VTRYVRRLRSSVRAGLVAATVLCMAVALSPVPTSAAGAAANIDQCTNGAVGPPISKEPCLIGTLGGTKFANWVNGNSNGNKSHWREGEFISYRVTVTGLTVGSHTIVFHYDTVHGAKHALDYVGSFDKTETTSPVASTFNRNDNNPCFDILGTAAVPPQCTAPGTAPTPASTFAVPAASLVNCNGSAGTPPAQVAGSFNTFGPAGATITAASYVAQNAISGSGQCSTAMSLTFMEPTANAPIVLTWGGHIASQRDWGLGNSASAISGSPYHMALDSLDGASTGSQDRALSTTAIFFTPTIATTLSASSIGVGGSASDSATLTGASSNAGGTVTYTVYTNTTCTTAATTGAGGQINAQPLSVTVTNGVVPNSASVTFNSAGTYYWQATYSGDSINIGPVSSLCTSEQLVVGKASPTIATTLSETTGAIGDTVHDSAALTGATSNAGGTVTYTVYTDSACSLGAQAAGTKTVTNGVVPDSNGIQFNSAGTFYWQAVYSGDANNNGATSSCTSEKLVIGKNSPSIATTLSESAGAIGDTVHDSAALTGATSNAGGTVTYTVYTDNACSAGAQAAGTKTVTNGLVPDSDGIQFNSAGTFYWQAVYSGDANNNGATSSCTSEKLVIAPNSPSIATTLSESAGAIGDTVHDSAALTGATSNAAGTVTYTVYTDNACSAGAQAAGTKTVTNGVVPDSNGIQFNSAGTFYWQAVYSGDANNNGASSSCTSETLVINKNKPGMTTAQNLLPNDSATITGATSTAGGSITFNLFKPSDATCAAAPAFTQTVSVVGNGTYPTTNTTFKATDTGEWRWQVIYSGDANNDGTSSACGVENFTITNG
jgi:hypothetical protein